MQGLYQERRPELNRKLDLNQIDAIKQTLAKRKKNDPHAWAYRYANNPRDFFAELISDWSDDSWTAWRSFISAVFGQPFQSQEELTIFQQCTELAEQPVKRPPSVWIPVGRRGGKSRVLAAITVHLATCYDWRPYLDPGELGVLPVLAADRRQARTIMGYVKAFLEHPQLKDLVEHDSAESIRLKGSILVEVVTASYRAVRSRTVIAALCDEVGFWRSEDSSVNPDYEIIAALEPAMATVPNALLLGASSPYARRGVLWDNFDKYYGQPNGPLIWKAPTWVMNPTIPQEFLDEKYREDPLSAAAEYGAEFRTDVDAFLTKEALDSCIRDTHEWPPRPGFTYQAFVDPSGGTSDSFTLAIGHVDKATGHGVIDSIRERRPPFSPDDVVKDFCDLLKLYRVAQVEGDFYGGEWVRERFRLQGVNYKVCEKRKSDIYLEFLPILNATRVELLDNRTMYNQFLALERRIARGGYESIDHPPGGHDDIANVVAGVLVRLVGKRNPTNIDPEVLQRSARIYTRPSLDRIGPVWR